MDYGYNMTYKFLVELEDEWKLAFAYSYTDDGRSAACHGEGGFGQPT